MISLGQCFCLCNISLLVAAKTIPLTFKKIFIVKNLRHTEKKRISIINSHEPIIQLQELLIFFSFCFI